MKTTHKLLHSVFALVAVFASALLPLHLSAQTSFVPSAMNYQGFLTDSNGDPVAPTAPENHTVQFRIWDAGAGGSALWGEEQIVTVFKGNFSVILGNGSAVGLPAGPAAFANLFTEATAENLYFGIQVGAAELVPRQKLLASAYALRAKVAERVHQTTGNSTFAGLAAQALYLDGHARINGQNRIVFGADLPNREFNAGTIGYQVFTGGLDIVGAGETIATRAITMIAEGGTVFEGGPIRFGRRVGQHINLWGTEYGIGVQDNVLYHRAPSGSFHFYQGGSHANEAGNPGAGGGVIATLTPAGLTLHPGGKFIGDGSGLTNLNVAGVPDNFNNLGINGTGAIEFGRGIEGKGPSSGKIGYQHFSDALDIVGAGPENSRKILLHVQGGQLIIEGSTTSHGNINLGAHQVDKGGHHGVFIGTISNNHSMGSQDFTTFFRTGENFAFYRGGTWTTAEMDPGADGHRMMSLEPSGLHVAESAFVNKNLTLGGNTLQLGANSGDANIAVGNTGWVLHAHPGSSFEFHNAGTTVARVTGVGDYVKVSDRRLKTEISPVNDALSGVLELKPSSYRFKSQEQPARREVGFIAQEVREVFPELVSESDDGILGLNYDGFIPLTVSAVQEQQKQIGALRDENAALKERLGALEAKFEQLAGIK